MTEGRDPLPARGRRRAVRAVIFDAGNTLLRMNYAAIAAHLAGRGLAVSAADVEEAELRARVRLDPHLGAGASTESSPSQRRYLRYVLEPLGVTDETLIEDVAGWRRRYNPPVGVWDRAAPGATEALRAVKAAGLVAGVISNSDGSARAILEAAGLGPWLDFVVDSSEVGVEKPDPRIFGLAVAGVGLSAGEAVYVGDLYSVDVLGARAAGLHPVLLDPRGYWGPRDCDRAPGLVEAVRVGLDGVGPPGSG